MIRESKRLCFEEIKKSEITAGKEICINKENRVNIKRKKRYELSKQAIITLCYYKDTIMSLNV